MSGLLLTALTEVGKDAYNDDLIQDLWVDNAKSIPNYIKKRAKEFTAGGTQAVFAFELGPAASVITTGEAGKFHGRDTSLNESVSTGTYDNIKVGMRYMHGIVQASMPALHMAENAPGVDNRYMVRAWMNDLKNVVRTFSNKWLFHFLLGSDGFLWKISDTSGVTNVSTGVYDIVIDTDTTASDSRKYMQQAWSGFPNIPVQLVNVSNGRLTEAAGHGVIQSVINETTIRIAIDGGGSITPSSYSSSQAVAWYRRERTTSANTLYEPYGLANMIDDTSAFPIAGSGDTAIDPASVGEWKSVKNAAASSGQGTVEDLDGLFDDMYDYAGVDPDGDELVIMTTRNFATKLLQEKHASTEYMPTSRNDNRTTGYTMFHNGTEIKCHRAMPKGVAYVWDQNALAMSDIGKRGPFWLNTGQVGVGGASTFVEIDNDSPLVYAKLGHYYNNAIINRRRCGVLTALD